jgi:nucleoside-diphosphate-sugar epimerase
MRVLVLGGTRFIGRAIVDELLAAGHEVLVAHRGQTEPEGLAVVPVHVHVDRHDRDGLSGAIRGFEPEALVDTRALTKADAEAIVGVVGDGIRLVVLSSCDVYRAFGSLLDGVATDPVPLTEESPVRPPERRYLYRGQREDLFDYEKLDLEPVYLDRGGTVLRLPMVYGEHDYQRREEFVLRRVRAGRQRIPFGSGQWLTCAGYVGEIARATRLAVESPRAAGEIFNLAETPCWPVILRARQILDAAGFDGELVRVPDAALPADLEETGSLSQHLMVDSSKARQALGWVHGAPEPFVRRSVAWHLAHPPEDEDPDFSADDAALAQAL